MELIGAIAIIAFVIFLVVKNSDKRGAPRSAAVGSAEIDAWINYAEAAKKGNRFRGGKARTPA